MNSQFSTAVDRVPVLFEILDSSSPLSARGVIAQKNLPGVYAFYEDGRPVHVGRTRNLQGRLRGHVTKSHNSASFAFKRAKAELGKVATYKPVGSRAELAKDFEFLPVFHRHIELIRGMEVRFVEVHDAIEQYLLELYAHFGYDLLLDEFDTH